MSAYSLLKQEQLQLAQASFRKQSYISYQFLGVENDEQYLSNISVILRWQARCILWTSPTPHFLRDASTAAGSPWSRPKKSSSVLQTLLPHMPPAYPWHPAHPGTLATPWRALPRLACHWEPTATAFWKPRINSGPGLISYWIFIVAHGPNHSTIAGSKVSSIQQKTHHRNRSTQSRDSALRHLCKAANLKRPRWKVA